MSTYTRKRGVTVRLVDLSKHLDRALAFAQLEQPDEGWTKATYLAAPYALGTASDGTEYLIDTEGVGFPLDGDPVEFDVYLEAGNTFNMFPTISQTITVEEIHDAVTGEEVDLADHVRTFGARLDDNHALWFRILTEEKES